MKLWNSSEFNWTSESQREIKFIKIKWGRKNWFGGNTILNNLDMYIEALEKDEKSNEYLDTS